MKLTGHYGILLRLCILVSLCSVITTLTPPRILYGGWTPILPGHPFHFGSMRRKFLEQIRHQEQYTGEHIPSSYQQQTPSHEVEHHFEHHVEFVEPQQYRQPTIYAGPQDHARGHQISPSGPHKEPHPGYQSTYKGQPIREQHSSLEQQKQHYPQQPSLNGHHAQPVKGQQIIPYGHKPSNYYPPQSAYGESHVQKPVKDQHITYGYKPNKNVYDHYPPQSAYDGPTVQKTVKEQHNTYGHKSNKNIFSYYPPQSIYEGPKQRDNYKPVYFEIPRKPLDVLEIPKQKAPYILPSVNPSVPIKTLNLHDFSHGENLGEKTYLRITPLDHSALKVIGDANLGAIQYLSHESPKQEKYPIIKDSSGGTPKYPKIAQHAFPTYGKHSAPAAQQNYGIRGIIMDQHLANGLGYPLNSYKRRPLNPIETKKYRNPSLYTTQNLHGNDLSLKLNSLTSIPTAPVYTSSPGLHSSLKYPSRSFGISKNYLSPVVLNNNLANQVKKYLGPNIPSYKSPVLKPFYPRAPVPTSVFPYQPITKPLVHIPPLRTMPKVLPNNYLKMHTLYKDPGIVANIHGAPALVEREVAIIHVPVTSNKKQYPAEKEYLYYTASTPESTHVLDNENYDNRSISTFEKAVESEDGEGSVEQGFSSADSGGNQRGIPTSEIDGNSLDGKSRYHDTSEYIYVSGTDIQEDPEAKKQFFHAYYAAADHMPPPGYVRMTLQEFDNLFRNAEIRYVDKEPTNVSANDERRNS